MKPFYQYCTITSVPYYYIDIVQNRCYLVILYRVKLYSILRSLRMSPTQLNILIELSRVVWKVENSVADPGSMMEKIRIRDP